MAKQSSNTLSASGDTTVVTWAGGEGFYSATGTWGSGTTTLYASFDGGTTYISCGATGTLTANGVIRFMLPECKLKVTLSGATSPSLVVTVESLK
jgi:hypothetical protein